MKRNAFLAAFYLSIACLLIAQVVIPREATGASMFQTNAPPVGTGSTNLLHRSSTLTNSQRRLYYSATHANRHPTQSQLNAITVQDVNQFEGSAVLSNGVWRMITAQTNIPLSSLTGIHSRMPISNAFSKVVIAHTSNAPSSVPLP